MMMKTPCLISTIYAPLVQWVGFQLLKRTTKVTVVPTLILMKTDTSIRWTTALQMRTRPRAIWTGTGWVMRVMLTKMAMESLHPKTTVRVT